MLHKSIKIVSFVLTLTILMTSLPLQAFCLGEEYVEPSAYEEYDSEQPPEYEKGKAVDPSDAVYEDIGLRTANEKFMRMTDGSHTAVSYAFDVHYLDHDAYVEYDNTLVPSSAGYTPKSTDMKISFVEKSGGDIFSYGKDNFAIRASLSSAKSVPAEIQAKEKVKYETKLETITNLQKVTSSLVYSDILENTDIEYILYGHNLKENLILKSIPKKASFDFILNLENCLPKLDEDGSVLFVNLSGEIVAHIPAGFMTDAAGAYSREISYKISECEEGFIFSIIPSMDWLCDKNRVFPVTVDPTIILGEYNTTVMADASVLEGSPTTPTTGNHMLYIGYSSYASSHRMRSFVKINDFPVLPDSSMIVSASLNLEQVLSGAWFSYTSPQNYLHITAKKVTSAWSDAVTWNTQPSFSNDILDYCTMTAATEGQTFCLDITSAVQDWKANAASNYGIVLQTENESAEGSVSVFSFDNPADTVISPLFSICYRDTRGLDDRWSYSAQNAGEAGSGYVNLYNGNLVFVHNDIATLGGILPITVSHVYNAYQRNLQFVPDNRAGGNVNAPITAAFDMNVGYGWKLSLCESVTEKTLPQDGSQWIVWNDSDGTELYFYDYSDGTNSNWLSEDGYSLTITITGSGTSKKYIMTDDQGNKKTFDANGFLQTIEDNVGNKKTLVYSSGRITSVRYRPAGTSTDTTQLTLQYSAATGALWKIVNALDTSNYVLFSYSSTYNGAVSSANSGYLRKIECYRNNTLCSSCSYTYTSGGYLYRVTDDTDHTALLYNTQNNKVTYVREYSSSNDYGQRVSYSYSDNQTTVTSGGTDDTYNTGDDIKTVYVFDNYGRSDTVYCTDKNGTALYAVGNTSYTPSVETTGTNPKKNNKIIGEAVSGSYPANLVANGNVETTTGWSNHTDTGYTTSLNAANHYLGNYSASVTSSGGSGYGSWYQYVTVPEDGTYTLSAYVKTSNVTSSAGGACLVLDGVRSEFVTGTTNVAVNNGWKRISVTTSLSAGSRNISVRISNAVGTAYFDCIQLEKADAPGTFNLIDNGTFSASRTWGTSNGASYTSSGFLGNGITMTASPESSRYTSQSVKINKKGSAFILSGWAKANSVSLTDDSVFAGNASYAHQTRYFNLQAYIAYSDGTNERQYVYFNPDIKNEWQFASGVILSDADKTVTSVTVFLQYTNNCNTAIFDNISLTEENANCYEYDENGKVSEVSNTGGANESLAYTGTDLTNVQSATGEKYDYTYDSHHNLTSATDKAGVSSEYTYDARGNVTGVSISPISGINRITTGYSYTSDGNYLTKTTDSLGNETDYSYQSTTGFLSYVENANNKRTAYTYDPAGKLTAIFLDKNSNGTMEIASESGARYVYNASEQLSEIMTGSTTYHFTYDNYGNVLTIKVGNSATPLVSYTYGPQNGKLLSITYADGTVMANTYDHLDRIKSVSYNGVVAYTVTYDGNGNISSYTDDIGRKYCYEYDTVGRLVRYTVKQGSTDLLTAENGYDSASRLSTSKYVIGGTTLTQGFSYDSYGRLSSISTGGSTISYGYDSFERLSSRTISPSGGTLYTENYSYLTQNGKTATQVSQKRYVSGGTTIKTFNYTYDSLGNILSENDGTTTKEYTYDDLNQLTSEAVYPNATGIGTMTMWTYDKAGNILHSDSYTYVHASGAAFMNSSNLYRYEDSNWGDLLTSYAGHSITYDANGNPLSYYNGQDYTFAWNKGRQLASTTTVGRTVAYTYDANGIRATKTIAGVKHTYLTDGNRIIKESWGNLYLLYFYDENGAINGIEYFNGSTATKYQFLKNLQGDVVTIRSGSSIIANYTYDAYGKVLSITDASGNTINDPTSIANINPIRYRGYYYDTETGLYYVSSRYYDPEVGRFISPDSTDVLTATPMALTDKNLYAYCDNNPVNRVDHGGQFWETVFDVISLGASIVEVCVNPTDPWAWAGLVGDAIDLIPFVTGVGEVTRGVKTTVKVVDKADDVVDTAKTIYKTADKASDIRKATGSYEIIYESGKNYVGKGGFSRAIQSAQRYGDDVATSIMWKSAPNAKQAFIDEYLMQTKRGVLSSNKNAYTYNKIWSPGKRLFGR